MLPGQLGSRESRAAGGVGLLQGQRPTGWRGCCLGEVYGEARKGKGTAGAERGGARRSKHTQRKRCCLQGRGSKPAHCEPHHLQKVENFTAKWANQQAASPNTRLCIALPKKAVATDMTAKAAAQSAASMARSCMISRECCMSYIISCERCIGRSSRAGRMCSRSCPGLAANTVAVAPRRQRRGGSRQVAPAHAGPGEQE